MTAAARSWNRVRVKPGHSVFVSSHVLAEMQAACDRYVVIRNGELLFSGTSDELIGRSAKTVTAIPQRVDDLGRMADHIRRRGWSATLTDRSVVIEAESHAAAQINQACFDVGVVLRELRVGHEDLEDVFLAMVDVRKRAVPAGVAR